ncbi:OmpA family protein [Methylomicrobium lacus]|uniref:OmpA family protein n=1 Tax=Methylomicrobium lacus TaxID=136992 RepID=UPI0035A86E93
MMPANSLTILSRLALFAISGIVLPACSQSYVVLLEEDEGSVGKVRITTHEGITVLEKAREGAKIGGKPGKTFAVSQQQIDQDFGAALAASPIKPVSFQLYFKEGGIRLTEASAADLPKILEEIGRRPAPDISVIGHTDTVGNAQDNERLSLDRAKTTASLLQKNRLHVIHVTIESHGEKNPLVPTPDNTEEPRNRRVEVTVR